MLVVNERRLELDQTAAVWAWARDVTLRADECDAGSDELFTDWVNRRIGYLREQLLEVIIHRLRLIGEDRQWRVVTHRAEGLFASLCTGPEDEAGVFKGIAKCFLTCFDVFVIISNECLWLWKILRLD